jgi:pimeloyl-ACP methyl ester carboxylesterase
VQQLRPQWGQALRQSLADPAWQHHPSTYVQCSADRALDPRIQRDVYAARAQQLVTIGSGHSPFLSQPQRVARVLVSLLQ